MAFQSVPDCAEAEIVFTQNNVNVQNSLKFHYTAGVYNEDNIVALAQVLDGWVTDFYKPLVSNQVAYIGVFTRGLNDENDFEGFNLTGAGAGGVSSAPMPNNVSIAVKFETGFTGRTARGRAYMIGTPVAALAADENFINDTAANNIVAAWIGLADYVESVDWEHVVVSRFHNGVKRTTGVFRRVTGHLLVDKRIDSQRGRLP